MEACEGRGSVLQGSVLTNKRSCVDSLRRALAPSLARGHTKRGSVQRGLAQEESTPHSSSRYMTHGTLLLPL